MTDDHLSLDELAELDEGLITSARADAMREHAQGCAECGPKLEALAETRSMLANLPPVTMPADVRARLDRALADEANPTPADGPAIELVPDLDPEPRGDSAPPIDSTARSADVMPAPGSVVVRPRFGRPTAASSAAAAALVLVVGAVIVGHYHHGSDGDSAGSAGSGAASASGTSALNLAPNSVKASMTITSTDKIYTATNLAKQIQSGGVPSVVPNVNVPTSGTENPANTTPNPESSGNGAGSSSSTTKPNGGKQTKSPSSVAPSSTSTMGNQAVLNKTVPKALLPLYNSKKKILACAASLTGDNTVPLRVDFGYYSDATHHKKLPSAIFVFANKSPSSVTVWVTNPSCSGNKVVRTYNGEVGVTN